jgi:hypothetical protein
MREVADDGRIRRFMRAPARSTSTSSSSRTPTPCFGRFRGSKSRFNSTSSWRRLCASGAWDYFVAIEPQLFRYPAVDPGSFRRAMELMYGPQFQRGT